jgi:hypothetical protein
MKTLSFPLYHSTSTLFTSSIKEFGLGGFNIIKELKVIELLKELETLADMHLGNHDEWRYTPKLTVSYFTRQEILPGGNFQHGEVYLTPSLFTARSYSENKYGSEAITVTFMLLDLLKKHNILIDNRQASCYKKLLEFKEKSCEPVIYKLSNLPLIYLKGGERGQNLSLMIAQVEELKNEAEKNNYDFEAAVQQHNFRLGQPIPWDILMS